MSCGKPHKVPCSEVLEQVYAYLDHEIPDASCDEIRQQPGRVRAMPARVRP